MAMSRYWKLDFRAVEFTVEIYVQLEKDGS